MADTPKDLSELPDAALNETIVRARKRYNLLEKFMGPFPVGALLIASLAVPLMLLSQPASIIVALATTAASAMVLGGIRGVLQRRAHDEELDCAIEKDMRRSDPPRYMRALKDRFGKAMHGGTEQQITVKKPLKLKAPSAGSTP